MLRLMVRGRSMRAMAGGGRSWGSLVLSAVLALGLLLGPAPAAHGQAGSGAVVVIDSPGAEAAVSGVVSISGWAADPAAPTGTGVAQVQVYADGERDRGGRLLGEAQYGADRDDVGASLGGRFVPSGFSFDWDTLSVAPGPHRLYVYARTPAGAWANAAVGVGVERAPNGPTAGAPSGRGTGGGITLAPAAAPLPAPSPGLPRFAGHPTEAGVRQVLALSPAAGSIAKWAQIDAEFDQDSGASVVALALYPGEQIQPWLTLTLAAQEQFLRQLLVNLSAAYPDEDELQLGVVLGLATKRRADIPDYVPEKYIQKKRDTYIAIWPDVVAAYEVASGRMLFKSIRMSRPGPSLTN